MLYKGLGPLLYGVIRLRRVSKKTGAKVFDGSIEIARPVR